MCPGTVNGCSRKAQNALRHVKSEQNKFTGEAPHERQRKSNTFMDPEMGRGKMTSGTITRKLVKKTCRKLSILRKQQNLFCP